MIGKTKIELFNESGELIHEQRDKNMLTNAFKFSYETMTNMAAPYKETNIIADAITRITQKTFFDGGGILLFKDPKVEDANIMATNKPAFAYGGSNYSNTEKDRGSLNTEESKDIVIDGRTVGRRFVWDFPTHCANGQFQCVCLTHKSYGDKAKGYVKLSSYAHEDSRNLPMIGIRNRNSKFLKKRMSLGMDGSVIVAQDDRFIISKDFKFNLGKLGFESMEDAEGETVVVAGYRKLCKVIDDAINGLYITCGYSLSTGKWHLIKLDRSSKQIVEDIELTNLALDRNGVDRTCNKEVYDFGIAGDYFVYNPPSYRDGSHGDFYNSVNTYNMKTQKQSSRHYVASMTTSTDYLDREFYWIGTVWTEDGYECFVSAQSPYYNEQNYGTAFINHKNERYLHLRNNIPMNIGVLPHALTDNNSLDQLGFGFAMRPIYTINNLDRPVEKTEANTMKVTYEIIWDELVPEIENARLEYFEEGTGLFTIAANGLEPETEYIAKIKSSKGEANLAITSDINGRIQFGINHSSLTDNFTGVDVNVALFLNGNKITSDYKLGTIVRPVINYKQFFNHANGCYYQNYVELNNHVMMFSNYDFYASGADQIKCYGSWIRVDGNNGKYTITYKHKYQSESVRDTTIKFTNKKMSFSPNAKDKDWSLNTNRLFGTQFPLYDNHRSLFVSYEKDGEQTFIKCDTMYDSTDIYANGYQNRYNKKAEENVWSMITTNSNYKLEKYFDKYYIADALHSPENDFCRYYDPYYERFDYFKETFRLEFETPDNKFYANFIELDDNLSVKYMFSNGTPTFANEGFTFTEDYVAYAADGTFVDSYAANTPQIGVAKESSKYIPEKIQRTIFSNRKIYRHNNVMYQSYIKTADKKFYCEDGKAIMYSELKQFSTPGHWEVKGGVLVNKWRGYNTVCETIIPTEGMTSLRIEYDMQTNKDNHYFEIVINDVKVHRVSGYLYDQVFTHEISSGDVVKLHYRTDGYGTEGWNEIRIKSINNHCSYIVFSAEAIDTNGSIYPALSKITLPEEIISTSNDIIFESNFKYIMGDANFYETKVEDIVQLEFDAGSKALFEYEDESILDISEVIAIKSKDVEIPNEKVQDTSNGAIYKFTLDNFNNFGSVDGFKEV